MEDNRENKGMNREKERVVKKQQNFLFWHKKRDPKTEAEQEEDPINKANSNVVKIPQTGTGVSPPLKAETRVAGKFSNPVILWPLYALGGYLILRWAWGRWKERRAHNDDNDEDDDINDDNDHVSRDHKI